jgi:hypothetical protein
MKYFMILMVFVVFITQGCSTLKSSTQQINITCTPTEGVTLIVNGQKQKQCPIQMDVPRNQKLQIEAAKDNYLPYNKTVDHHLSTTAKLDMAGICVTFFSGFGLLAPGAWDLDETSIDIVLSPFHPGETTLP